MRWAKVRLPCPWCAYKDAHPADYEISDHADDYFAHRVPCNEIADASPDVGSKSISYGEQLPSVRFATARLRWTSAWWRQRPKSEETSKAAGK